MKEIEKKLFKKTIENPSPDFASKVMMSINTEEKALSNALMQHTKESSSSSFTEAVMGQLEKKKTSFYQPIISKKIWFGIACCFVLIISLTFIMTSKNADTTTFVPTYQFDKTLPLFKSPYASYSILTILGISLLLLIDQLMHRNKQKRIL